MCKIIGREGPTVSTTPNQLNLNHNHNHTQLNNQLNHQLNHNPPDQSNMSLLNLKFKRRKVDSRDSDGKI